MQFQVPQFLDVEDKIIGPFTSKQFIFLLGGAGLAYMSFHFIPYIGLILAFASLAFGWALGFYRPNKKPFADYLEHALLYIKGDRRYVWKRVDKGAMPTELNLSNFQTTKSGGALPGTGNKLSDLTWSMDTNAKQIFSDKADSKTAVI